MIECLSKKQGIHSKFNNAKLLNPLDNMANLEFLSTNFTFNRL